MSARNQEAAEMTAQGGALGMQGGAALHGAVENRGEVIDRPRWHGSTLRTRRAHPVVEVLEVVCQLEVLVHLLRSAVSSVSTMWRRGARQILMIEHT